MNPTANTPDSLYAALRDELDAQTLPPVDQWHPDRSGRIDIQILSDGRWLHEGVEIKRQGLVKVLASVLRRDEDGFCLVTPAERLLIVVDDAPFVAGGMDIKGGGTDDQELLFTTNIGELVVASEAHPISVSYEHAKDPDEPRPYIEIRPGLHALIGRNVFYRLVELGEQEGDKLYVRSAGQRFLLGQL